MRPADIYTLAEAKCNDSEILAYAAMSATGSQWKAIKRTKHWLDLVRSDEIERACRE